MSQPMKENDPAYILLDNVPRTPKTVHRDGCYICEDRRYARMLAKVFP